MMVNTEGMTAAGIERKATCQVSEGGIIGAGWARVWRSEVWVLMGD